VILTRLQLQHFRNYPRLDLALEPGSTLLYGPNGAGKTNIVEAVFTLAATKSFRARADREMIDRTLDPSEPPFPFARLQGDAVDNGREPVRVEILIAAAESRNGSGEGAVRKRFRLNGSARRAGDIVGQIKAVLFSPGDVDIVIGSPSARRRYMDLMLCQIDYSYLRTLQSYGRVVQQRNAVLTKLQGRSQCSVLNVWDEKLVADGSELMLRRLAMMSRLGPLARETYRELAGGGETLDVAYVPSAGAVEGGGAGVLDATGSSAGHGGAISADRLGTVYDNGTLVGETDRDASVARISSAFREKLASETNRVAEQRVTIVGPHRDDLTLLLDGAPLMAFGSRGQQRTASLALRIAEARFIREATGRQPILLLDEALGELDEERREHLLRFVTSAPQVILTGTSEHAFDEEFWRAATLLQIRDGSIIRG
jgi:DNA replication and repair protein RecF